MNARNELKKFLLSNIDFSDYDNKQDTIEEVFNTFREEYLNPNVLGNANNYMPKAVKEWLLGLPSCIDMPFYYGEITPLMKSLGYDVKSCYDEAISDLYFSELGEIVAEAQPKNFKMWAIKI